MSFIRSDDIDYRLVAFYPWTVNGKRGPLPMSYTWTYTHVEFGIPQLTIHYKQGSTRSEWLDEPCEIAVEVWDGEDWVEKDFCRLLVLVRDYDRLDRTGDVTYTAYGLGWILTRMNIHDATEVDPGDGPAAPLRIWTDPTPGQMLVPTFNAAVDRCFESIAVPLTAPPEKEFELLLDGNGVPWAETIPGTVTRRITDKLASIVALHIQTGVAEPRWYKRQFYYLNFGTYGEDLSDTVILRDVHGVTSSPERKDWTEIASRALVTGDEGQIYIRENEDADTSYGALEQSSSVSGLSDPDALHKAARELIVFGESELEQLTNEGTGGVEGPKPLRDFHVSDTIRRQRDAAEGNRFPPVQCVEISITREKGRNIKWHAKFGDRHEDRLARAVRRAAQMSAGEVTSPGGRPNDPTGDPRRPAAPENVQVTTTTYADDHVPPRTLASQVITWDEVTTDNDLLDPQPMNIKGYEIGERRHGVTAMIATVGPEEFSWQRDDVKPGARDLSVRAIGHNLQRSLYSDDVDGTVTSEAEPPTGPNRVLDPRFTMTSLNTRRAANAGAGFAFGSSGGRMRAQFTSTTPHLRARIGGTNDAGWFTVSEGEKFLVGGSDRFTGTGSVGARYGVQWANEAGTVTDVDNVVTHTATGTNTRTVAEWTVPAGAIKAAWKVKAVNLTGSPTLEVVDPIFERRSSTERIEDLAVIEGKVATDAISTGKIQSLAVTEPKNADNSTSRRTIVALAVDNGKIDDDATDARVLGTNAVQTVHLDSNLAVDGTVTTATGLTIGGLDASDIDFPGSAKIADTGTGLAFLGVSNAAFSDSGTYTGTWTDVSTRASKVNIKKVTREQCDALLGLKPVMFKRREAWSRKYGEKVIPDKELPERWEADPKRPGKKRRVKAKRIKGKVIPGKVDKRPHVGLIAEDVRDTGCLDVLVAEDHKGNLGVDYTKVPMFMLPVLAGLVEQVRDLAAEVAQLKDQTRGKSAPSGA